MAKRKWIRIAVLVSWVVVTSTAHGAEIWGGFSFEFGVEAFADPSLAENQDRLTDGVWLTRGNVRGIYNAAQEDFVRDDSPADTRWAFAGLNGNPAEISAVRFSDLNFEVWRDALGGNGNLRDNILNRAGVMHLISDDIYIDVRFIEWAVGSDAGGSFTYLRGVRGDSDGDGVLDSDDNCQTWPNPAQFDADADGFGNRCDADFNGDCLTNVDDLVIFRDRFFQPDPAADLDGDGFVDLADLTVLRALLFGEPGPSALASCTPAS
ncbi:MAG: thrombospondin type 3 repeat-containing protein [Pseudomonadota bacterium]